MAHTVKDLVLTENDTKTFQNSMESELAKPIKHFETELLKIRTGRAHTNLIEDIEVSCYGQAPVALRGLAVLAAPDARLLTIQPWDASLIYDIEKAILASDIGLHPQNDGKLIRLQLPEMSSARREELLKILGKRAEETKIAIRNTRKDFHNAIRDSKKDKKISENFFNRLEDLLETITEKFIKKVEELSQKKEKDVTSF